MIDAHVTSECERLVIDRRELRFSQRHVREMSAWTDFQVKTHMRKLLEMEYLLIHRGGRGQSFVYELMYRGEGEGGRPFLTVTGERSDERSPARSEKRIESVADVTPGSLGDFVKQWIDYLRVRNYAQGSLTHREYQMRYFLVWCGDRGLTRPRTRSRSP
jgi:hypothetical protein